MAKEMRHEIFELKAKVIEMANVSLSMLDDAVKALHLRDLQLAEDVDKKKHLLRDFDVQIEAATLRVIALYQPMAIDLRRLATILKVITYLYRLGRYGKDIAAVVEEVSGESRLSEVLGIVHMWEHVKPMIEDAIEAFDKSDTTKIKNFEERDTEIDHMRWSVFRESVSYIMENPKNTTVCAHMIMIARYLERCGDHACKIAEKVWYMVTGDHIEIS